MFSASFSKLITAAVLAVLCLVDSASTISSTWVGKCLDTPSDGSLPARIHRTWDMPSIVPHSTQHTLSRYNAIKDPVLVNDDYPWRGAIFSATLASDQIYLAIRKDESSPDILTSTKFIFDLNDAHGASVRTLFLDAFDSCAVRWRAGERKKVASVGVYDHK